MAKSPSFFKQNGLSPLQQLVYHTVSDQYHRNKLNTFVSLGNFVKKFWLCPCILLLGTLNKQFEWRIFTGCAVPPVHNYSCNARSRPTFQDFGLLLWQGCAITREMIMFPGRSAPHASSVATLSLNFMHRLSWVYIRVELIIIIT